MDDVSNTHSDGSPRTAAAQKRARDAAAIGLTEDAGPDKKHKVALNAIAEEHVCPLTWQLPLDPVMAEDGRIYEEEDIRDWFAEKRESGKPPTSPATGLVIGTRLVPAVQARNTIEVLVKSGAIDGEIADAWTEKLDQEKIVMKEMEDLRAKADGGDEEAMHRIGKNYELGINGLAKDKVQARSWFERSAAARDPRGLASFGKCLLFGSGGPKDTALGLDMVRQAAALGSDLGFYLLGRAFFHGHFGLSQDPVQARFWLEKVVFGLPRHDTWHCDAAGMIGMLEMDELG